LEYSIDRKYSIDFENPVNNSCVPTAISELPWKKMIGLRLMVSASEALPPYAPPTKSNL
jgi:hypothetical protein